MNGRNLSRILAAILSFGGVGSFASASASEGKTNKVETSSVEVVESSEVKNGEVASKKCLAKVKRMVDKNGEVSYTEYEVDDPEKVEELVKQFNMRLWSSFGFDEMIFGDLSVEDLLNYFYGGYDGDVIVEEVESGDVGHTAPAVGESSGSVNNEIKDDKKDVKVESGDVAPAPVVNDNPAPVSEEVKGDENYVKVEGSNDVAPASVVVENVTPEAKVVEPNVVENSTSKGEDNEKKVDVAKSEVSGEVKA